MPLPPLRLLLLLLSGLVCACCFPAAAVLAFGVEVAGLQQRQACRRGRGGNRFTASIVRSTHIV